MATARVSAAILSSSGALTSVPTPKVKIRRLCGLDFMATSRMAASEVWPTVGRPSVRKRTIGNIPSVGLARRASIRASWMFVPPRAWMVFRYSSAFLAVSRSLMTGPVRERFDGVAEEDDVEGLAFIEAGDDLAGGLADLVDLLAPHAAGVVEDQRHFALDARAPLAGLLRGHPRQQQEVPALGPVRIGEERCRDAVGVEQVGDADRPRLVGGLRRHADGHDVVVGAD